LRKFTGNEFDDLISNEKFCDQFYPHRFVKKKLLW